MIIALYIALGGALGTMARFLTGLGLQRVLGDRLPYGTFAVNVLGSFVIGFAMAHFAVRGQMGSHFRMALTIGFLGGFTTYSSFAYETVSLLQSARVGTAAAYVALTMVIAGLSCYGGMLAGRAYGVG